MGGGSSPLVCNLPPDMFRHYKTVYRNQMLVLRAFVRLEYRCFIKEISWFEAKTSIIRDAVRAYLAQPVYTLEPISLYATA